MHTCNQEIPLIEFIFFLNTSHSFDSYSTNIWVSDVLGTVLI